jgi:aspartate-semialdehyde dehydrogenase
MKHIAIVGATGAVGAELLSVLASRRFPVASLRPLASERSAGKTVTFAGQTLEVGLAEPGAFAGIDIAFFSAGATRSRALIPAARAAGAVVIDNSSAFRMAPDVPLVVPEVNPEALAQHQGLIANPNCVAAILTVAVAPLKALGTIRRLVVSTYQSASGAGARAMEELLEQTRATLAGEPVVPKVLKHPFAFNLFSHDSAIEANSYNGEENKVVAETGKILGMEDLAMSVTCVRVPVLRAHTMTINVEFDRPVAPEAARAAIAAAAGVQLADDEANNHFPMPLEASGHDDVLVGRIRRDPSHANALNLLVCGDQLLKGAALNAVQIAERL